MTDFLPHHHSTVARTEEELKGFQKTKSEFCYQSHLVEVKGHDSKRATNADAPHLIKISFCYYQI